MQQPSERLQVGSVIDGRYTLIRELGAGGFATVFEAQQQHLGRSVAVKVLNASLHQSDATFEARFLQEAQIASQLQHPNVVTIHEFGSAGPLNQPFIAMEMLAGHDLETEIQHAPMRPSRAIPLFLDVLDALAAGHQMGVVHKDLKPANLFLSHPNQRREALIVLDYGIARWDIDAADDLTAAGQFNGTPNYVAPEYARSQEVSPAIDVYQIALVLSEVLTQRRVVDVKNPMGCVMRHVAGNLDIPDVVRTSSIGPAVVAALSLEPADRPAGAEFAALLSAVDLEALDAHFARAGDGSATVPGDDDNTEFDQVDPFDETMARPAELATPHAEVRPVPLPVVLPREALPQRAAVQPVPPTIMSPREAAAVIPSSLADTTSRPVAPPTPAQPRERWWFAGFGALAIVFAMIALAVLRITDDSVDTSAPSVEAPHEPVIALPVSRPARPPTKAKQEQETGGQTSGRVRSTPPRRRTRAPDEPEASPKEEPRRFSF